MGGGGNSNNLGALGNIQLFITWSQSLPSKQWCFCQISPFPLFLYYFFSWRWNVLFLFFHCLYPFLFFFLSCFCLWKVLLESEFGPKATNVLPTLASSTLYSNMHSTVTKNVGILVLCRKWSAIFKPFNCKLHSYLGDFQKNLKM